MRKMKEKKLIEWGLAAQTANGWRLTTDKV
jgi:hypothetical protein